MSHWLLLCNFLEAIEVHQVHVYSKLLKFIQILYVYICFVDGFNQDFCLCLWQIIYWPCITESFWQISKETTFESHQSQDSNSAGALKNQSYKDVTKNMQLRPCAPPAETSPLSLDTSRTDRRKQKSQVSTTFYVTGKANLWTRTCCGDDAGASTSDAGDDGIHLSFFPQHIATIGQQGVRRDAAIIMGGVDVTWRTSRILGQICSSNPPGPATLENQPAHLLLATDWLTQWVAKSHSDCLGCQNEWLEWPSCCCVCKLQY